MKRRVGRPLPYLIGIHQFWMYAYIIFTDEEQIYYTIIGLN
jgi:hypothetical protein